MIDWITKHTEEAEEVVDIITNSLGVIITKATPLLAPMSSGFTVFFAFYDGGGRILKGAVDYPYVCSFIIGFILMIALEGINFSTTFNRDRAERLKESHSQEVNIVNANALVSYAFWLTVALIFGLETLPGIVGFYYGSVTGSDLAFKCGLLLLPFFSKIGAMVFSLSLMLDNLEGIQESRRLRRQLIKRQEAEFEIEIEALRQSSSLKLHQTEAENKQKLEIERLKIEAKLQQKGVARDVARSVAGERNTPMQQDNATHRRNTLLTLLQQYGDIGPSEFGRKLDADRTTIYRDFKSLEKDGIVHYNGNGWTVS